MTQAPDHTHDASTEAQQSLLAPADMNIRVLPSQLARMLNVSKQCVSQWIKCGKLTLGPDGRVNPAQACDEVLRNSDPTRLRAKVLRPLVNDVGSLRREIQERDHLIESLRARVVYLESLCSESEDAEQVLFTRLVPAQWDTLRALGSDQIGAALVDLMDEALIAVDDCIDTDEDRPLQEPDPEIESLNTETDALLFGAMRDIPDPD